MAEKTLGRDGLLIQLSAKITDLMGLYFSPEQQLQEELIPVFAENLIDQYPLEYIGDIGAFFARASMGRYAERDKNGNRKVYGRITMIVLADWWSKYLEERVEEEERQRLKGHGSVAPMEMDDKVLAAIKESSLNPIVDESGKRIKKLLKHGALMTPEQLRAAWKESTTAHEKSLIMKYAHRLGLVVKKIEDNLNTETP
jgi:hypothetical protein